MKECAETEVMSKETISLKLKEIERLECKIEKRVIEKATLATDENGEELSEVNIKAKIAVLANELVTTFKDANPLLIGIMDGAMPFAAALNDAITIVDEKYQFQFTTMQASSYHGTESTGTVTIKAPPKISVKARTVVLVDDVCDSGRTGKAIKDLFLAQGADQVFLMVLVNKIDKEKEREVNCHPDFSGYTLPKQGNFIIGMGLDYDGGCRNLRAIYRADPTSLKTDEEKATIAMRSTYHEMMDACNKTEKESNTPKPTWFVNNQKEQPKVEEQNNLVANNT